VIEIGQKTCNNKNAPIKSQTGETPVAQSFEPKVELNQGCQSCRKKQSRQKTVAQSQSV
jgi:hypothetical protein